MISVLAALRLCDLQRLEASAEHPTAATSMALSKPTTRRLRAEVADEMAASFQGSYTVVVVFPVCSGPGSAVGEAVVSLT
mmetsp:Transcript_8399/g.18845  ORF Transcript_8399/g.18845 Transcript_8399/m.18845 type:complete len:80 (-) Transcript_8399:902-1141(-)